jgi:hypothetical protein
MCLYSIQKARPTVKPFRLGRNCLILSAAAAIAISLAGCAGKDLPGVHEYLGVTAEARASVLTGLASLEKVSAQHDSVSKKLVASFEKEVESLELHSIQTRSHVKAMEARGDAYFKDWSENIGRMKNPKIRELAETHRPELEQAFSRIKAASQRAGAEFRPFLSGLREVQVELEAAGSQTKPDVIASTRERGQRVVRELDSLQSELQSIITLLTPGKASNKH